MPSSLVAGAAGRYATALFELAREGDILDDIAKDLADLDALVVASDDLAALIASPLYSRDAQAGALDAVLEKAGAHQLVRNFIGLVCAKRRIFALRAIIAAFGALLRAHRGEVTAEVISAQALNDAQTKAITDALKEAAGRDVDLTLAVDESLLGGLVVKLGSRMVDTSLKTKLSNLQISMKEVG